MAQINSKIFVIFAIMCIGLIIFVGFELNTKKNEIFLNKPLVIRQVNSSEVDFVVLQNNTSSEVNIGKYTLGDGNSICTLPKNTILPAHDKVHIYFRKNNSIFATKKGRVMATEDILCETFGISLGETINLMNSSGEVLDSGDAR